MYRYHFRGVSNVEIIAEFENAEEALLQIPQLKPDIVIVDYSLPGMSGIEFAEQLNQHPKIKVLLVTGHEPDHFNSGLRGSPNFDIVKKDWSEQAIERIIALCK